MLKKKVLALVLVLCMLFSMVPTYAAKNDVYGHWAETDMLRLSSLGIMEGYEDGSYKPDKYVKKSEFIKLMNRAFGLERKASITYGDVASNVWYYPEIQRAEAAGYMFTFSKQVRPERDLSREEAAAMFGKLLGLYSTETSRFEDASSISSWALPYVTAVEKAGIINGYPGDIFSPKGTITRAESATIISRTIGKYYNVAGTYTELVDKNATVAESGVTLRNMTIPGDLYIAESVGTGTVTLENVKVQGRVLTVGSPNATLVLKGENTEVEVMSNVTVRVASAINKLTVSSGYTTNITVDNGASVALLTLGSAANVTGAGTIKKAVINASGSTFAKKPLEWSFRSGIGATMEGTYTTTAGVSDNGFVSGYPKATLKQSVLNAANVTIEATAKLTKPGYLHYVAVIADSAQPTAQQIKLPGSTGSTTIAKDGHTPVYDTASEIVVTLSELPSTMQYDVWMVVEDIATGVLGTPVKVTPERPIYAQDPFVQSVTDTTATISVKLNKNATVFWAAVPKTSVTTPTAQQIIAQTATYGLICGNKPFTANYLDSFTVTGLTLGASAYDIYLVTRDAAGNISPATPTKLTLSDMANTMTVTYSTTPTNGEYMTYTNITLTFAKEMYRKTNSDKTLISFLIPEALKSCLTITATDVATGQQTVITDYTVTANGNKSMTIRPIPMWAEATIYTVEVKDLVSLDNAAPSPAKFDFSTYRAGSIVAAPTASKPNGVTVYPGEKITLSTATPGAMIEYRDPMTGSLLYGSGSGVTVQIPDMPTVQIQARAFANGQYSQQITFHYSVARDAVMPKLVTDQGIEIPDGMTMAAGSTIYLTCSDPDATVYYIVSDTDDGTSPDKTTSSHASGASRTPILVQASTTSKFYIKALAVKGSGSDQTVSSVVTFTINVLQSSVNGAMMAPVFLLNGNTVSQQIQYVQNVDHLTVANYSGASAIYYTISYAYDTTTDPRNPTSNRVMINGTGGEIPLSMYGYQSMVIRATAYNGYSYSDVATLTVNFYNPFPNT
ncbi:MAG: S-layer homology domain-containing protein [Clostridia bacterium]|nr:S-layer homology domain-containing protein [Clostridia bacterium]